MHRFLKILTLLFMSERIDPQKSVTAAVTRAPFTQTALARQLGLPAASVCDRVKGRSRWQLDELVTIADMLGVTLDDLAKAGRS